MAIDLIDDDQSCLLLWHRHFPRRPGLDHTVILEVLAKDAISLRRLKYALV